MQRGENLSLAISYETARSGRPTLFIHLFDCQRPCRCLAGPIFVPTAWQATDSLRPRIRLRV
jgi:hypothetical protein